MPDEILGDPEAFVNLGMRGVALVDGEEVFCEQVSNEALEAWKEAKSDAAGDARLLGNHVSNGKRKLELSAAVDLMKGVKPEDAGLSGPPVAKEFLNSVAEGPGNLISYHAEWIRLSGVSESAAVTHSHKNLMEILRLMHYRDQLDISALAAGEFIVRWAVIQQGVAAFSCACPDRCCGVNRIGGK